MKKWIINFNMENCLSRRNPDKTIEGLEAEVQCMTLPVNTAMLTIFKTA